MRRVTILAVAATLTLAACGAEPSADDPADPTVPTDPTSAADPGDGEEPGATEAAGDDPEEVVGGFRDEEAWAVVVIGDDRYEFEGLYCVTFGGAVSAASIGGDPSVNISLPPMDWETSAEDWEPPSVRVDSDEPYADFRAGGEVVEFDTRIDSGMSQVDSFESDGYQASGSATFVNLAIFDQPLEPVSGTFEVSCPRP